MSRLAKLALDDIRLRGLSIELEIAERLVDQTLRINNDLRTIEMEHVIQINMNSLHAALEEILSVIGKRIHYQESLAKGGKVDGEIKPREFIRQPFALTGQDNATYDTGIVTEKKLDSRGYPKAD